jgi:trans-2,3-dihydro-3-hydroxyanthranilate isomerase
MVVVDVCQVNAFTIDLAGGNPAGVVISADSLTENQMAATAIEMGLSETAFVFMPTSDQADVRLRFFTRSGLEVPLCGHATVAALFQLARLKDMFGFDDPKEETSVRVETNVQILQATIINRAGVIRIAFVAPEVELQPYRLQGKEFAEAFGVGSQLIDPRGTILLDSKLRYLYIPTASLDALQDQLFDSDHILQHFGDEKIKVFCLFANEGVQLMADVHARVLAPLIGIDEDAFTGSMQAGLVRAAKQGGYIRDDQPHVITEQGHSLGRPGYAQVHEAPTGTVVTAHAVYVCTTRIEVDAQ